jgi:hypothetical protein
MRVKKYNENNSVVFEWEGSIQLGIIESVVINKKSRKYIVRAESGRLYPEMGVDTVADYPGRILSDLTEKYYAKNPKPSLTPLIEQDYDFGND